MTSFLRTCYYEASYLSYYLLSLDGKYLFPIIGQYPLYGKNDSAANLAVMHHAIRNNIEFVKYLVAHKGADINSIDWYGSSPLHMATAAQAIQTANFLLENGANIDIKNIHGLTPLSDSARIGAIKSVKFLLEKGADVNADNQILIGMLSKLFDLNTSKYIRPNVNENFAEILKLLIEHGVDLSPITELLSNQGVSFTEKQQHDLMQFILPKKETSSISSDDDTKLNSIDDSVELVEHLDNTESPYIY